MKINRNEKAQGLLRMILFLVIFANVKRFDIQTFIMTSELLNEVKGEKVLKHSISVRSILFQICVM